MEHLDFLERKLSGLQLSNAPTDGLVDDFELLVDEVLAANTHHNGTSATEIDDAAILLSVLLDRLNKRDKPQQSQTNIPHRQRSKGEMAAGTNKATTKSPQRKSSGTCGLPSAVPGAPERKQSAQISSQAPRLSPEEKTRIIAELLNEVQKRRAAAEEDRAQKARQEKEPTFQEKTRLRSLAQEIEKRRKDTIAAAVAPYEAATMNAARSLAAVIKNLSEKTDPYIDLSTAAIRATQTLIKLAGSMETVEQYQDDVSSTLRLTATVVSQLAQSTKQLTLNEVEAHEESLRKAAYDLLVMVKELRKTVEENMTTLYDSGLLQGTEQTSAAPFVLGADLPTTAGPDQ
eukprot:comp91970_c0_seq1/m.48587 comp91970_c0_seq1/g.48587  ORF comp91970_c0_seq1/g.48587 comp91970_c0_seq1/m.48587 type:complete len:345 (-) comp91970_c0_seq1:61-1095(-)